MSGLVPTETIGGIVGAPRDPYAHIGRAVSDEARVYILHSQECVAQRDDLTTCPYSIALDAGVDGGVWEHFEDVPVLLAINADWGDLEPVRVVTP